MERLGLDTPEGLALEGQRSSGFWSTLCLYQSWLLAVISTYPSFQLFNCILLQKCPLVNELIPAALINSGIPSPCAQLPSHPRKPLLSSPSSHSTVFPGYQDKSQRELLRKSEVPKKNICPCVQLPSSCLCAVPLTCIIGIGPSVQSAGLGSLYQGD
jgi:hypothetical protein